MCDSILPVGTFTQERDGMCEACIYQAYRHWRKVAHVVVKEILDYDKPRSDRFEDIHRRPDPVG